MITTMAKVRDICGLDDNAGIEDEQIFTYIEMAERQVRRDVFKYEHQVQPSCHPKTGLSWNGTNTRFQTKYPIADYDFDQTTSDDVTGIWIDSDFVVQTCSITVNNAKYGLIDIYQSDGSSAIPSTAEDVLINYYWNDEEIEFSVLEDMGTLLVCHMLQKRLTEPKAVDITDIENDKKLLFLKNRDFLYEYRDLVKRYSEPLLEGT